MIENIDDQRLLDFGLNNGDKICMINKRVLKGENHAWEIIQSTPVGNFVEFVILIQDIRLNPKHPLNYANPYGASKNNLHDELSFET